MVVDFPPPVVPPAAREAAKLKIEELSRARALFHSRYNTSSEGAKADGGVLKRLSDLLDQIKELDPYLERDKDLSTLTRLVEQASHDQSISQNKLLRLESDLFDKLEKHANRLEISSMHVEMLEEFFNSELSDVSSVTARIDNTVLDDDFEVVEKGLESVFENFEKNTFTSKDVDVVAIKKYLDDFFAGEASQNILQHMRTSMANFGSDVMLGRERLDEDTVVWCIEDLLANSLIGDDKRKTLQGYLQSPVALRELTGALNAKSVRHWNYKNVEQGLTVTARQNAEGEYCIAVEEDIIDMLALHTLAVGWSMKLKSVMRQAVCYQEIWGGSNHISIVEQEGIEYWLLGTRYRASSCSKSMPPPPPPPPVVDTIYDYGPIRAGPPPRRRGPVPPPPPPPVGPSPVHYQRNSLKTKRPRIPLSTPPLPPLPPLPPPGPMYIGSDINSERYRNYTRSFFLSRIPKLLGASPDRANASETQALLLKTLVLEAHLRRAFDGSVHGVAANFKSFASSLPHETILTVLEFIGVPDKWLEIFKRYLQVPLNLGPVVRGTGDRILTRTRGVSVGHGLEAFFGEAIMFFLDIAIHRKTGTYLYRLRDKCYFVGSEEQCSTASAEISRFAATMGLEVTPKKMIEEPIGFVNITASGQTVSHALDTARVKSYALRVRQCLSRCSTIIGWIRTWNATVGTYAAHLFGPLANVFGKEHLKAVTEAYDLMHHIVLQGQDLTSHVQALLRAHLKRDPHDRPVPPSYLEALIYLPHAYGGLGLKNPYNTLSLAREVHDAPREEIKRYLDSEHKYYDTAKQTFERMTPAQKAEKLFNIFEDDKDRIEASLGASVDPTVFPPLEVITAHRERFTYYSIPLPPISVVSGHVYSDPPNLAKTYFTLLYEPRDYISGNDKLRDEVESLGGKLGMKEWADLSGEDRWTLQVYGEECIEAYGRLAVWHGESVPREVLRMVRGEVEDSWDDGMSTSSGDTIMSDA